MTTLTLARLAEIEQAAADAIQWRTLTANGHHFGNVCDPATVAALCRIARAAESYYKTQNYGEPWSELEAALHNAGLIE